ncbi:hypothetical protein [Acaryochloris marina]|uniref:hypothetical protein n=1 Tax=Acaryochloris marina TaxID=155978 RepID=UPI0008FFDDC2|nr:hypothetical protein [Acaryochloris marina]
MCEPKLITWNLRQVMDEHKIQPAILAEHMQTTPVAISRMRRPKMPRMEEDKLNHLLICLNALRKSGTPPIGIADLLVFTFTVEEAAKARINES